MLSISDAKSECTQQSDVPPCWCRRRSQPRQSFQPLVMAEAVQLRVQHVLLGAMTVRQCGLPLAGSEQSSCQQYMVTPHHEHTVAACTIL
jgi:hypothetical protein